MQNNRPVKFHSEFQLNFKCLPHTWCDRLALEPIQPDLTDAKPRIFLKLLPKLCNLFPHFSSLFPLPSSLFPCIPRMHANEVAPDQELAHRRVAARSVTMGVGHSSFFPLPSSLIALKRSFNAILIDSVAMPAVIFE